MGEAAIIESFSYSFELAWSNLQWWASISFALIALATFGRERLNFLISISVSVLYSLFSVYTWQNSMAAVAIATGRTNQLFAMRDANELSPAGMGLIQWIEQWGRLNGGIGLACYVATYLGTLAYLWYAYHRKHRLS